MHRKCFVIDKTCQKMYCIRATATQRKIFLHIFYFTARLHVCHENNEQSRMQHCHQGCGGSFLCPFQKPLKPVTHIRPDYELQQKKSVRVGGRLQQANFNLEITIFLLFAACCLDVHASEQSRTCLFSSELFFFSKMVQDGHYRGTSQ